MNILLLVSLVSACTAGVIILIYESLATQQGWPVGRLFRGAGFFALLGGLSIIGSVIFAFSISWQTALLVLVGGYLAAFILSFIFKQYVQYVALLLLLTPWIEQFFLS